MPVAMALRRKAWLAPEYIRTEMPVASAAVMLKALAEAPKAKATGR